MTPADLENRAGKYLTFQLSRQYFAVRSDRVKQILPMADIRNTVPKMPCLYGSVPSNGRLVPVLDVRERLTVNPFPLRPSGSVLVVALDERCPLSVVGLVVDKLSEVVHLKDSDIRGNIAQMRIGGRPYGRPKILVDIETLLLPQEWATIGSVLL